MEKWVIADIDNTLIGDKEELDKFLDWYQNNKHSIGFGVATGRNINSTLEVLKQNNVFHPQILITSVGAEIYYLQNNELVFDEKWQAKISDEWEPDNIRMALNEFDFLVLHDDQREHKIGYFIEGYNYKKIQVVKKKLRELGIRHKVIIAERKYVDIVPYRVSKYKALKYVCSELEIDVEDVLVVGDSGNDSDMLRKMPNAVVVFNHQKEISKLRNVYFSKKKYAGAILDGLSYYKIV